MEEYKRFIGKKVRIIKNVDGKPYFYRGIVIDVTKDNIILNDVFAGEMLISLKAISEIQLNGDNR